MLLVTAFEPFGAWDHNPTVDVAAGVVAEIPDARTVTLPVDLGAAPNLLRAHLRDASAVLLLGLHGRARAVRVERVAINVADFRIADNAGRTVRSAPLVPGAPEGLLTTVDVRAVVDGIRDLDVPADVSNSAGTYLCNAAYYVALHDAPARPCLFVHLPPLPGTAADAAERLQAMRDAGDVPAGPPSHLTGEDGGIDSNAGLALDAQVRAALLCARHLLEVA